ncbi:MAG: hypothetical protein Q7J85_10485 [Bacillota bacterium]|nr:hypothetical protein [Bacillota bacterium]
MTIKIIAAIFAAYECYKLLNVEPFKELIERTKAAGNLDTDSQVMAVMTDPFFKRVMLIELSYVIFAVILLFTVYWYFTIVMFSFSIAIILFDTTGRKGSLILGIGSAISAALLMTIVMA